MSGISSILNIGKEALLTHQTSISVAANNIANVDTPGYTRQTLTLTTAQSSPVGVGYLGGGVEAVSIERQYDQFITQQLINQNSTLSNLTAQQEVYQLVETIFNEAEGLAVNDLLSQFWNSWQELANNPETTGTQQTVVQQGQTLVDQLQNMYTEIIELRSQVGVSIGAAVDEVNTLTGQIADLNQLISSTETPSQQQNDLRDQRDELVKELSGLVDVQYFETDNGSYTILLANDGHTLVENNKQWDVSWSDNTLYWQNSDANGVTTKTAVKNGAEVGGEIGGFIELNNQLAEGNPDNYLGQLDSFSNALIREVNQQYSQGVGLAPFSEEITGTTVPDTALLMTTIDAAQASQDIAAGAIQINDRSIGEIDGGATINGLAMDKAANTAEAINDANAGVTAKLTTLVAGDAVNTGLAVGESVSFTVNSIAVTYTATAVETASQSATNVTAAINSALDAYNADPTNNPKMTIEAVLGDGSNGGAADSIVLKNTNDGDQSSIVIAGVDSSDPAEGKLGLANGTFIADEDHNTGEVAFFSTEPFTIEAGNDDRYLDQLGLGGGNVSADDEAGDGRLSFSTTDNSVTGSLQGLDYADELSLDGGSFDIWLYNVDGSLALTEPVTVSLDRAYTLDDVADAVNTAITSATGNSSAWVEATVQQNQLVLTPDADHQFAFANDNSNFLASAEINTFFIGNSTATIAINTTVADNLDYLASGKVGETGEILSGDNSNALLLSSLSDKEDVFFVGNTEEDSLDGFYSTLVGSIGLDSNTVNDNVEYNTMLAEQLLNFRDSASGVSLDEEMANLIKYQQAYSAAAKLITMADEMLQTLLQIV